jgi:hypothetical protein
MTNIHRLPPIPKVRRHGVIRCEISEDVQMRDLAALRTIGLCATTHNGVLRIERANSKRGER